jgi:CubicO group peptidase (beta-lactamase class C family)
MFGGCPQRSRRLRLVKPIAPLDAVRVTEPDDLVAGELIPALTRQSWSDFLEARVLRLLGMANGNARGFGNASGANTARPNARLAGAVRSLSITPRAGYGAGGVNASAADMARWLRLLLAGGEIDGTKLVDASVVGAMMTPQTIMRPMVWMPGANFATYGLGWFLHDYRGRKVAQHGGNAEGWSAVVGLIPDAKLGVAVLANMNGSGLPHALMFRTFDTYLGEPVTDWSGRFLVAERKTVAAAPAPATVSNAQPAALERYAGAYDHPAYGLARVVLESGRLVFRYGPQTVGDLAFERGDTFRTDWREDSLRVLTGRPALSFRTGAAGIEAFVLELADDKIEFVRIAQ